MDGGRGLLYIFFFVVVVIVAPRQLQCIDLFRAIRSVRHVTAPLPTGHCDRPPDSGGAHGHLEFEAAAVAHAAHARPHAVAHAPHRGRRCRACVGVAGEEVPPVRVRGAADSALLHKHWSATPPIDSQAARALPSGPEGHPERVGGLLGRWVAAWAAASQRTFDPAVPRGHVAPRALQEGASGRLEGDAPPVEGVHDLPWAVQGAK